MASADGQQLLNIELVWSPAAGEVRRADLMVPAGTTVGQVLAAQQIVMVGLKVGIWGRLRTLESVLFDRDRIEVYRPLTIDPMSARRRRYEARGERIVSRHRPLAGKASR